MNGIFELIRFAEKNQLILKMIKKLQDEIKSIKTMFNLMIAMPMIKKLADNCVKEMLIEAEKFVPTKKKRWKKWRKWRVPKRNYNREDKIKEFEKELHKLKND